MLIIADLVNNTDDDKYNEPQHESNNISTGNKEGVTRSKKITRNEKQWKRNVAKEWETQERNMLQEEMLKLDLKFFSP